MTPNSDGTFVLEWAAIPKGTASYNIFSKEGTAADPLARQAQFDFTHPLNRVTENRFVTENVLLKYNVCYAVRLIYPKYTDTNTNEICTNHIRLEFAGIASATASSSGVALTWVRIPMSGIQYWIYESSTSGVYNYATPNQQLSDINNYTAAAVPLGQTRCYIVRAYKEGAPADSNTKEICVGEGALANFAGIETAVSTGTGSATITWKSAGSIAKNYRIYQGVDFSKLVETVSTDATSDSISTFTPGKTYDIGVRAVDENGREDSNTKTISVKMLDLSAPVFTGVAQLTLNGARTVKVTWQGASPIPTKYDIFIGRKDSLHTDASLNCDLPRNETACRDIIDWTVSYASAAGSATDYTLTNVGDDQTLFVAVRAVSESGTSDSNIVTKSIAIPDAGAPIFAGISNAEIVAGGKAKLTWSVPLGQVSNFNIYSTVGGATTSVIIPAMLPISCTTSCTDVVVEYTTGVLLSNSTYTFKVIAEDKNRAADTNTVTKTATTGDTQAPGIVSGVSAVGLSESSMSISFTSPTDNDVNKYEVRYEKCLLTATYPTSCSGNLWGTKTLANIINPTSYPASSNTNILILGLDARTVYRFYVRAVDTSNNPANEVSVTKATLDTTAPTFSGIASVVQNPSYPSQVLVSWDSPGGDVASYVIYRRMGSLSGLTLTRTSYPGDVQIQLVNEPTVTYSYADLTTAAETWYFTVHAVDDQGNEDTNTAQRSYTVPDLTPPAFDANTMTAAWNSPQDAIVLNWTAPAGVAQYKLEAQCINVKETGGAAGTWPSLAPWPQTTNWIELATLGAASTSYNLTRTGTVGTCAGAEYRSYRFRMHARKSTSDWDTNVVVQPSVTGATIPDLTIPTWPTAATLTGLQTSDTAGAETIQLSWPEATEVYTTPTRNASGLASYDIYLIRNTVPRRVLIKNAITGSLSGSTRTLTISASDMSTACAAPKELPTATPTAAINDGTCLFQAMQSYTFAIRALDNAGNLHNQNQELAQARRLGRDANASRQENFFCCA